MTKYKLFLVLVSLFVLFSTTFVLNTVLAQIDCQNANPSDFSAGDAQFCSDQLANLINLYLPAQQTNKKNLSALQSQLNDINKRITALSVQLTTLSSNIIKRKEDMAFTQKIFEQKTVDNYMFLRTYDPVSPFLFSDSASTAFTQIILRQRVAEDDRQNIDNYAQEIVQLQKDKDSLDLAQKNLSSSQKELAQKTNFLAGEVAKVDAYLATLSAKQEAFLAAKLDSLGLSRSAYNMKGGCTDDRNIDPGFSPRIAFFTFGVPNRIGMNQFGAKGRASAGQSAQTILTAYYNANYTTGYSQSINIHVVGKNEYGQSFNDTWSIDDYLKHLYEMPTSSDWPDEALRAQAIAARSYALSYTNNGASSICPSQQCQVIKRELNDGRWQAAVDATRGIVMTAGGNPIKAWFSSTHGGYEYTSSDIGWSATSWTKRLQDSTGSINSFSDLFNNAYDKSSPTFYCDWGSRASYNKTAWLKPEEVADIVNVWMLAKQDSSAQSHLAPVDVPNPDGTDTWDAGTVRSKLGGSAFTTISDVSISADFGTGRVTNVHVSGDAGSKDIPGDDFKNYLNLRAPADIQIVGPLFNVEKR